MFSNKFYGVLFGVLILLPQSAFAYFTTDQKAYQINNDTLLYTVTYRFGMEKFDLELPVVALSDDSSLATTTALTYNFINKKEEVMMVASSQAIILSAAPIVDSQYQIKKGESADFTLVAFVTLDPDALTARPETDLDLALRVHSLPFMMTSAEQTIMSKLNPSELKYYTTPFLDIK
jgi:hypothetical protein